MTARTRAQINSDADANIETNITNAVTAADVRQRVKDIADSVLMPEDSPTNPGFASAEYIIPQGIVSLTDRTPSTSAQAGAYPFYFPQAKVIDRIFHYLTTAQVGAECRVGIYANSNGRPSTLILDAGTMDLATGGAADKSLTIAQSVSGWFWIVTFLKDVATQATLKGVNTTGSSLAGSVVATTLSAAVAPKPYLMANMTYPVGVLPATPAVVPTTSSTSSMPVPMLRIT